MTLWFKVDFFFVPHFSVKSVFSDLEWLIYSGFPSYIHRASSSIVLALYCFLKFPDSFALSSSLYLKLLFLCIVSVLLIFDSTANYFFSEQVLSSKETLVSSVLLTLLQAPWIYLLLEKEDPSQVQLQFSNTTLSSFPGSNCCWFHPALHPSGKSWFFSVSSYAEVDTMLTYGYWWFTFGIHGISCHLFLS